MEVNRKRVMADTIGLRLLRKRLMTPISTKEHDSRGSL